KVGVTSVGELRAARETARVKDAGEDRLAHPQLLLHCRARAADLVADNFFPALLAQPGDLRLESVCLDGRQVVAFAKELARRPGVVIRQHPLSQFLEINDHRSTSCASDDTANQSPRSNGLPSISFHCFF